LLCNVDRADKLTICSFAVAEAFARKLLKQQAKIAHLTLLLDFTIAKRHRNNLLFLSNIANEIYLCNTHAKLVLLESQKYNA
jgi:membrane-bound acyltransferase YfiQ involved in biofilm formation